MGASAVGRQMGHRRPRARLFEVLWEAAVRKKGSTRVLVRRRSFPPPLLFFPHFDALSFALIQPVIPPVLAFALSLSSFTFAVQSLHCFCCSTHCFFLLSSLSGSPVVPQLLLRLFFSGMDCFAHRAFDQFTIHYSPPVFLSLFFPLNLCSGSRLGRRRRHCRQQRRCS